ncbi:MAG: hypothetical protein M5U08_21495 [Burkholderiales bacterium]|nr:hypothetical protein [Burkholderiales bacterium]
MLRRIAGVAREELVTTVAGKHASDATGRGKPRAVVRWNCGSVSERLIVCGGDSGDGRDHVLRGHVVFAVIRPEVAHGDSRVFGFVVAARGESNGERACRPASDIAQQSRDGGAVGSAAQECAALDVVGSRAYAFAQRLEELISQGPETVATGFEELHPPVCICLDLAVGESRVPAGRHALHACVDRRRTGHHVEERVVVYPLQVDAAAGTRVLGDYTVGDTEDHALTSPLVEEIPDRHAVDGEQQLAAGSVHDGDSKVAA